MAGINMVMQFLGGLGLFIYGMKQMGEGLQKIAGKKLRRFLAILTDRPIKGVLVGTGVTAILQSSSATTVMIVGFVNAGLLALRQAIGVIMGANIGTTITAQLIAFNLTDYALHAVAIGAFLYLFGNREKINQIGQGIMGFGMLFLGLAVMSTSMEGLHHSPVFESLIEQLGVYPILGVVLGTFITVVLQSSSASLGLLISLMSTGVISYGIAVPILLGDNIGTTCTALLSSIGANRNARRAAVAHATFNVIGAGIIIILMYIVPDFPGFLEGIVGSFSRVIGQEASSVRMLANTHTIFNVLNTLIWLPFVGVMVGIVNKFIPKGEEPIKRGLVHLDERMLETPGMVMDQVRKELTRMHEIARDMVHEAREAFINKNLDIISEIRHKEEILNEIEAELLQFLTSIPHNSLSEEDIQTLDMYFAIIDDIENIGDDADNLALFAETRTESNIDFSEQATKELEKMFDYIEDMLEKSIKMVDTEDVDTYAPDLLAGEEKLDKLQRKHRNEHMKRLNQGTCLPSAGIIFLESLEDLEHISDQFADMAKSYQERDSKINKL